MNTTLKMLPFALIMAAGLAACDKAPAVSSYTHPTDAVRQSDGTYKYADGSVHNADGSQKTPAPAMRETPPAMRDTTKDKPVKPDAMTQGNNQSDLDVTAAIRKGIQSRDDVAMGTKSLLVIVTEKGTVTLKGQVATEAEKATIAEIAVANAAGRTVDNMLTVKPVN